MSIQTQINRIKDAVDLSYSAVNERKGTIPDELSIDKLPDAIRSINGSSGTLEPLNPSEVYENTRPSNWLPMPTPNENEMYILMKTSDKYPTLLAFTIGCDGVYKVEIDGKIETVSGGTKFETSIEPSILKQSMVKVWSESNIMSFEPSVHSKKISPSDFCAWSIMEISANLPAATRVTCGGTSLTSALVALRYFNCSNISIADATSMFYNCNSLTAIPSLDTSNVTSMDNMFYSCNSLTAIPSLDTSNVTSMDNMFYSCNSLTAIPSLDTSNVTSMDNMFYSCNSLTTIPSLDTSNVTSMDNMFYSCNSLTTIPSLDTSNVTSMDKMFQSCYSLTTIPSLDTSNVTSMNNMFYSCNSLTTIPSLDTSNVTSMNNMFYNCNSLTAIPSLDTSNVTSMNNMFQGCYSLTAIPSLDTSNVTSMNYMFQNCYSLTAIPSLDTSKVTTMSSTFYKCYSLTAIPSLDTSKVTTMSSTFNQCYSLTSVLFSPTVLNWSGYQIVLSNASLSHDAIVALFDSLPTITSSKMLTLAGNPGVSDLTDEEKNIATNKKWTLNL